MEHKSFATHDISSHKNLSHCQDLQEKCHQHGNSQVALFSSQHSEMSEPDWAEHVLAPTCQIALRYILIVFAWVWSEQSPGNSSRTDKRLTKIRKTCVIQLRFLSQQLSRQKVEVSWAGAGLSAWADCEQLHCEWVGLGGRQVKGSSLWCDAAIVRPQLCAPLSADWETTSTRLDFPKYHHFPVILEAEISLTVTAR